MTSSRLFPTPARRALLAEVDAGRVFRDAIGDDYISADRKVSAATRELEAAGWVELPEGDRRRTRTWKLTDLGRTTMTTTTTTTTVKPSLPQHREMTWAIDHNKGELLTSVRQRSIDAMLAAGWIEERETPGRFLLAGYFVTNAGRRAIGREDQAPATVPAEPCPVSGGMRARCTYGLGHPGACSWVLPVDEAHAEALAEETRRATEQAADAAPRFSAGTPEYAAYAAELRTELDKFAHGEPLAADAPAETSAPTSYVVHFARLGGNLSPAPLVTGPVDGPNHLADLIHRYARAHLLSRHVEVAVDLAARTGCVLAGIRNAGTFTLADPDEAVPFVHADLGAMPGYVPGWCGHRVAGSEWRAGFRVCEHCPDPRAVDNRPDEQPDGSPCACGQEGCSVCDFI